MLRRNGTFWVVAIISKNKILSENVLCFINSIKLGIILHVSPPKGIQNLSDENDTLSSPPYSSPRINQ